MFDKKYMNDPEEEALEELKELLARIVMQKQTGEPMEKIEQKEEAKEMEGMPHDGMEAEMGEGKEPYGEEEVEEEGPKLHLAEVSMDTMPEEDEKGSKAFKMLKGMKKMRY